MIDVICALVETLKANIDVYAIPCYACNRVMMCVVGVGSGGLLLVKPRTELRILRVFWIMTVGDVRHRCCSSVSVSV